MNIGPITAVAAKVRINGHAGPFQTCRILTYVPEGTVVNVHSTSIPVVIPRTWRKRMEGALRVVGSSGWRTSISDSHQVGQLKGPNGRFADISTTPPPAPSRSRMMTYR